MPNFDLDVDLKEFWGFEKLFLLITIDSAKITTSNEPQGMN